MLEEGAHEILIARKFLYLRTVSMSRESQTGRNVLKGAHVNVKAIQTELSVIGVEREELRWLRTLVWLLRHPDPSVPELARQALLYLTGAAEQRTAGSKMSDEPYYTDQNLVS
jgi:hypothetical protein